MGLPEGSPPLGPFRHQHSALASNPTLMRNSGSCHLPSARQSAVLRITARYLQAFLAVGEDV